MKKNQFYIQHLLVFFISVLVGINVVAQDYPKGYFRAPLDIPLFLAGNFGELRSDHYHAGIDIKTQGREGLPVLAAADGFVSRIAVSPYGYGNAIYITHPNGYTTVYGHLQKFIPKLDSITKVLQYRLQSFAVDTKFEENQFVIKKGEIIAWSGNSGSSGGPHLHFEIRETQTEKPTNPLLYDFDIKDTVSPIMYQLHIYSLKGGLSRIRKVYNLVGKNGDYTLEADLIPDVSGRLGFALDVRDYMNSVNNYYGIYTLSLYVDESLMHRFSFNKFSFEESHYINSHIDYGVSKQKKRRIHKLFHEENQDESFCDIASKGIVFLDHKIHNVHIVATDIKGNTSHLRFKIKANKTKQDKTKVKVDSLYWDKENTIKTDDIWCRIPAKSLYRTIEQSRAIKKIEQQSSNSTYSVLSELLPLHKKMEIGIRPDTIPVHLKDKAFVARIENDEIHFVGNLWKGDFLVGYTSKAGIFQVSLDTVAPQIKRWLGASFRYTGRLAYFIKDTQSGIKEYNGYIDGKWVLFEYDPKNHKLWHTLSEQIIDRGKRHKLRLEVTDQCGNKKVRQVEFTW